MKKMSIYEPAMCCESGLCGVRIDPELLRISTILSSLRKKGIVIDRFNLTSAPMAFVENKAISRLMSENGLDQLPAVLLDDEIIITGRYPSNEEILSYLDIPESYVAGSKTEKLDSCGCSDRNCC